MTSDILVIRGAFTWAVLGQVLGRAIYPKAYEDKPEYPCGLAGGPISYKIYNDHKDFSVSKEHPGFRSAHVCLHSNGVCFAPSLNVECDWALAKELYERVLKLGGRQ